MCMKNKKTKEENAFFKLINKHRIIFSIVIIILGLIAILIPQLIFRLPFIGESTISGIELIMFSSQIVSALFVIIGTVIAVWQYYLSSSKRIKELEFKRVEKAIELSNYYKDNILNRYSILKSVFDDYGITKMLESKRKNCEIKEFDVLELKELYTEEEIEKFSKLSTDKKFMESIIKIVSMYNLDIKGYNKCIKNINEGTKSVVEISANPNEVYSDFYKTYIMQTLNNAEYFAMAFTHKTADESVIYQSIYPTYLEMCFIMYYYIARYSDPKVSKLYTNLAALYCTWREREQEQKKDINKQTRNAGNHTGTVIN